MSARRRLFGNYGRRLVWSLPLAVAAALGLFILAASLIVSEQRRPARPTSFVVRAPTVQTVSRAWIAKQLARAGGQERLGKGRKGAGHVRGGAASVPSLLPLLASVAKSGALPSAAVRRPAIDMGGVSARLARRAVGTALAPMTHPGAGWGVRKWLTGPEGLYNLPDSGLRVTQLQGRCPHFRGFPPTGAVLITAVVDTSGRVGHIRFRGGHSPFDRQQAPLREAMHQWRFQALRVDGTLTAYRIFMIYALHKFSAPPPWPHCWWGNARQGRITKDSGTPKGNILKKFKWVLYVPKQGMPYAVKFGVVGAGQE